MMGHSTPTTKIKFSARKRVSILFMALTLVYLFNAYLFVGVHRAVRNDQTIDQAPPETPHSAKNKTGSETLTNKDSRPSAGYSLCRQNPYSPSLNATLFDVAKDADVWLSSLAENLESANSTDMKHWNHDRFFPFEPIATCEHSCIGGLCRDDRSKIACGMDTLKEGCIIYSIGGNNMWEFELDLVNKTPCEVHTFDCTGAIDRFRKPESDRIIFHHICLGVKPEPAPAECKGYSACGETKTIHDMQNMLGHKRIDLLKMDIEGFEWPIFESWPTLLNKSSFDWVLPFQILVEIHYRTRFPALFAGTGLTPGRKNDFRFAEDMVRLQERLLQMGYATVVRDDNSLCRHCTELSLVRFRCPNALDQV